MAEVYKPEPTRDVEVPPVKSIEPSKTHSEPRASHKPAPAAVGDVEDLAAKRRQQRLQRIEAIDKIEKSMLHEIDFVQNGDSVKPENMQTIEEIAKILKDYPELMIHIESHTNCSQTEKFNCNNGCRMVELSQRRVDTVKDLFIQRGCKNILVPKGWGCKHPIIGRKKAVRIFPEDLEHDVDA